MENIKFNLNKIFKYIELLTKFSDWQIAERGCASVVGFRGSGGLKGNLF